MYKEFYSIKTQIFTFKRTTPFWHVENTALSHNVTMTWMYKAINTITSVVFI